MIGFLQETLTGTRVFLFIIYYQYSSIYDKIERLGILK